MRHAAERGAEPAQPPPLLELLLLLLVLVLVLHEDSIIVPTIVEILLVLSRKCNCCAVGGWVLPLSLLCVRPEILLRFSALKGLTDLRLWSLPKKK